MCVSRACLVSLHLVCALLAFTLPASAGHKLKVDINDSDCDNAARPAGGDPFCNIQAAINDASAGDKIKVKDGTYVENIVSRKADMSFCAVCRVTGQIDNLLVHQRRLSDDRHVDTLFADFL